MVIQSIELLKENRVQLNPSCCKDVACDQVIGVIAKSLKWKTSEEIKDSYRSLMTDGGIEASTKECGCLCRDPLSGEAAEWPRKCISYGNDRLTYGTYVFNQKMKTQLFFNTNSSLDFKLNTPTYLMLHL